jgi:hypothetical protein
MLLQKRQKTGHRAWSGVLVAEGKGGMGERGRGGGGRQLVLRHARIRLCMPLAVLGTVSVHCLMPRHARPACLPPVWRALQAEHVALLGRDLAHMVSEASAALARLQQELAGLQVRQGLNGADQGCLACRQQQAGRRATSR